MARYTYLGDRLSDPSVRGALCDPVKRVDGKIVVGRGKALVGFSDGRGRRAPAATARGWTSRGSEREMNEQSGYVGQSVKVRSDERTGVITVEVTPHLGRSGLW